MTGKVPNLPQNQARHNNRLAFLMGFLRHPELVGSVIPSSRFLERRIVDAAEISNAKLVVEFGPGTGGTTSAMLQAMPESSRLLAIEIDNTFASLLGENPDPRLTVHNGSAEQIQETLALYNMTRPDAVVSGIPFSTMPADLGKRIIDAVWACLPPGGLFVAYQFRGRVAHLQKELLGEPYIETELLNVPPMRLYCWRKPEENIQ